jgi:predicted nucleic acid-binding protein
MARHERELVIDPIILGEIRFGILLMPKGKRRDRLERWFDEGIGRIECLPWTPTIGLRWARLLAELRATARAMPIKDSLIAATALSHGIPVATRNRRDFEPAGVEVLDPFAEAD